MGRTSSVEYRFSLLSPGYGKGGGRSEMCAMRRTHNPWSIGRAGPDRGTELCLNLAVQLTVHEREDRGRGGALPGGNGVAYVSEEVIEERAE